jgi:hypothetical protein
MEHIKLNIGEDLQKALEHLRKNFQPLSLPRLSDLQPPEINQDSFKNIESPFIAVQNEIRMLNAMILALVNLCGVPQKDFEKQILVELTALREKESDREK